MPSFKMKFSGVTILQGVEFSIFPIDFEWALQQCSATALPVITLLAFAFGRDLINYCFRRYDLAIPETKIHSMIK